MTTPDLRSLFDAQYQASRATTDVPLSLRRDRLQRIGRMLDEHGVALAEAVQADFGIRSARLTEVADIFVLRTLLSHTLGHLARWMKPQKVHTPIYLQPSRGEIQRQPLGVVGVISPWNYPVQLALGPVITALAAGNRVMLKPSELTPQTSALMAELVARLFAPDELCVVTGDAAMASDFAALPFDHLLFTGSTNVGRKVAQAAAANLTPTTLELGGKSPCIVDAQCDLEDAALKIAHGKLLNAGQTCIAPDYVLLPRGQEAAFAAAYTRAVARLFPQIAGNADYAAIISPRHYARLQQLVADAQTQGAQVQRIEPGAATSASTDGSTAGPHRHLLPALVFGTTDTMPLMQEEIFGPLMPILTFHSVEEAVNTVNAHMHPLALYIFTKNKKEARYVTSRCNYGGGCINDTIIHLANSHLGFGGVGESGMGNYHGKRSFDTFTHERSIVEKGTWMDLPIRYRPYTTTKNKLLRIFLK
mgnify:CR=1 FL=1